LSIRQSSKDVIVVSAGPDRQFGTEDDISEARDLSKWLKVIEKDDVQ
jgi:hypothetical protein